MSTERRQQTRKVPKDFTYIRVGEDSGGRVLNLSEDGLCFEALSPIRYTESFQFWLSFNLIDRIDGAGTIVWIDTAKRIAGIRFMQLSQYSRQQIHAWMNDVLVAEGIIEGERTEAVELPLTSQAHEVAEYSSAPATIEQTEEVNSALMSRDSESVVSSSDSAVFAPLAHSMAREAAITEEPDSMESEEMTPLTDMDSGTQWSRVTELVPLSRHLTASRMQFVRGILVGALVCAVIILPLFKLLGLRQKGGASVDVPGTTTTVSAGTLAEGQTPTPVADVLKPLLAVPAGSRFERTNRPGQSHGLGTKVRNGQGQDLVADPPSGSPDGGQAAALGGNVLSVDDVTRSIEQSTSSANRNVNPVRSGESFTTTAVQPGASATAEFPTFHRANPVSQPPVVASDVRPPPVGGDVRPPKLLASIAPVYPSLARNQRVAGDVKVDAVVGADGRVGDVTVLSGPVLLQRAAVDAVKRWKYEPGKLDGVTTPMHVTVVLRFLIPTP